jgi:hypothetical protein
MPAIFADKMPTFFDDIARQMMPKMLSHFLDCRRLGLMLPELSRRHPHAAISDDE